jgi:hypothetical protein
MRKKRIKSTRQEGSAKKVNGNNLVWNVSGPIRMDQRQQAIFNQNDPDSDLVRSVNPELGSRG